MYDKQGWQPMLDVIKEIPCDEDFERVRSLVKIDFIRKWYHTRSKKVQMVSLERCFEKQNHDIYNMEGENAHFVTFWRGFLMAMLITKSIANPLWIYS